MKSILLRMFLLIGCFTFCTTQQKSGDSLTRYQVDTILSASVDTSLVSVDSVDDYETRNQATGKIALYEVDLSLQDKFITMGDKQFSVWSILEHAYGGDENQEDSEDGEGNSLLDVNVWEKPFTDAHGGCSNRVVITLRQQSDFTSNTYNVFFAEYDGVEIKTEYQTFVSGHANMKDQSLNIVPGYSLSDGCETLVVEYFSRGEDEDDRWQNRTLSFYIAQDHFFINVLEVEIEDNAEFFGSQGDKSHTSTRSFEILKQKTNGLYDVTVNTTTSEGNSAKTYRYNGKVYLD